MTQGPRYVEAPEHSRAEWLRSCSRVRPCAPELKVVNRLEPAFDETLIMTPQTRAATTDDAPALVALMSGFYGEAGRPLPQLPATRAFHALLAEPKWGAIWLAEDDATAAGYVVLTLGFNMEYVGLRGAIDDLYVRSEGRGCGIGAALLATVRSACAARGVRTLQVEVGAENRTALRLYERAGYTDSRHRLLSLPLAVPVHAA